MRAVLQRVSEASVRVEDRTVGAIGQGLLVLLAVEEGDGEAEITWAARKTAELRIFADEEGKMNRSVEEVGGSVLAVSQFTLAARVGKGRRPSFGRAAPPDEAEALYEQFVAELTKRDLPVETGEFGAMMQVALVNDGPVTIVLER